MKKAEVQSSWVTNIRRIGSTVAPVVDSVRRGDTIYIKPDARFADGFEWRPVSKDGVIVVGWMAIDDTAVRLKWLEEPAPEPTPPAESLPKSPERNGDGSVVFNVVIPGQTVINLASAINNAHNATHKAAGLLRELAELEIRKHTLLAQLGEVLHDGAGQLGLAFTVLSQSQDSIAIQ